MASSDVQRKLTAILSADVAGYSRLMGADEEATIETLTAYRKVFTSEIKKHRGRVVDAKGDAILAEFASVVDAVKGAVEIQRELAEKNAELPDDRRMDFRIGINLGDVVVKDHVIYGDGVNVAARLESLAEPGGICISRPVYDQVESKLNLECEYLGEQQVKNIAKPVRAYRVNLLQSVGDKQLEQPERVPAGSLMPEGLSLDLPHRPSIAVLPFANMSGDPEQEYFTDGITEDIITELSRFRSLLVIARTSSCAYKGRAVNVQTIGKELGVHFVLEGSVRKAANRVRISAQLIDATDGKHLWAERFDRDLEDVFAVQDEITAKIVTALDVSLLDGEQARIWRNSTHSGQAYDLFLRGRNTLYQTMTREGNSQAIRLMEQAIELDPAFARAYAGLARQFLIQVRNGWSQAPEESLERALELANRAIALDESLDYAYSARSHYFLLKREFEQAQADGEKAVALNPEGADVALHLAQLQIVTGEAELAMENLRRAMRLAPGYHIWYPFYLGFTLVMLGRFEEALAPLQEALRSGQDFGIRRGILAAALAGLGREQEAKAEAQKMLREAPRFSVQEWAARQPYKNPADLEKITNLLRKAGLPE